MKMLPIAAALCASVFACHSASAMYLNPDGEGNALLYPYYTVNAGQQTLISVSNTDVVPKALKVTFREALNGRPALGFTLVLAAHDTWTGVVFALADAGLPGNAAAIGSNDSSCTLPALPSQTSSGLSYQAFLEYAYTGQYEDSGPTDLSRTREGSLEIIEMADLSMSGAQKLTSGCHALGVLADSDLAPPTGGLIGSAAIIDVSQGTFYRVNADAIAGFLLQARYMPPDGKDSTGWDDGSTSAGGTVDSTVYLNGQVQTLHYSPQHAVDAVSALFDAQQLDLGFERAAGTYTDWVLTFPTKRFYVDPPLIGSLSTAVAPFTQPFGGRSDVNLALSLWDRQGTAISANVPETLQYQTNVLSLAPTPDAATALGSLNAGLYVHVADNTAGSAALQLTPATEPHVLRISADGTVLKGLPVSGFEAVKYINANASPGVLGNYSSANSLHKK